MTEFFLYLYEHFPEIIDKLAEHLWIVLISMGAATLFGVSVGIGLSRAKKLAPTVLGMAGVIQTIPSIALLGFMIPVMGIGTQPAVIALFLYALLPIIRNTYLGIEEVPHEVKDAGLGMGMTNLQLLTKVELPLALPTIFAGIRTATVINVGVATLAAYIAAGGLGEFIFSGIALNNVMMMMAGAVPAAMLAVLLDLILALIQRHIRRLAIPVGIGTGLLILGTFAIQWLPGSDAPVFRAGFEHEFVKRQDGWEGLKEVYDLEMKVSLLQAGLMYKAVKEGQVDVICGYTTDGRIRAFDLKILEDDRHFFPPYDAVPLANRQTLMDHPELRSVIDTLSGLLNDSLMTALNYEVDHLKKNPEDVAKTFLQDRGFPTGILRDNAQADILIGTKNFTEQYILGEIYTLLIENLTTLDVSLKKGMGGTKICFDALRTGEIDLYPEYTGTALLAIIKPAPSDALRDRIISQKDSVYLYCQASLSGAPYHLEMMRPIGFENAYELVMSRNQAKKLGINTISDLAKVANKRR